MAQEVMDLSKVKGSELTTSKNYDPALKARAYELYLTTDLTLRDIAIELHVNDRIIAAWAKNDQWQTKRQALEDELALNAENAYRRLALTGKIKVAERHMEVAEKIEKAILRVLQEAEKMNDIPDDRQLKRLSEALASVTGVSARAVGLGTSDGGAARRLEEQNNQKQGKIPIVIIGLQGTLPQETQVRVAQTELPTEEKEIIDVSTDD